MNIKRFVVCWAAGHFLTLATSMFFIFSANYLRNGSLMFTSIIFSVAFAFIFGWLYFKAVKSMSWKYKIEVIIVWMGLSFLLDMVVFIYVYGGSWGDLGWVSLSSYLMITMAIFVAAYITSSEHPKLSSPNLIIQSDSDNKLKRSSAK